MALDDVQYAGQADARACDMANDPLARGSAPRPRAAPRAPDTCIRAALEALENATQLLPRNAQALVLDCQDCEAPYNRALSTASPARTARSSTRAKSCAP